MYPYTIKKYPRTPHIEGSGLQKGDFEETVPFQTIVNRNLVIEEKMDGANSGISFTDQGELLIQSRGHYLTGGPREKHFQLLKTWAHTYAHALWEVLNTRYIMYGEWMFAKHTIFYTQLPHYFLEFDLYDREKQIFLSTTHRRKILSSLPFVHSVKVLHEGQLSSQKDLLKLVQPSQFIDQTQLSSHLARVTQQYGLSFDRALQETDQTGFMEGLYIKVEEEGIVKERYKYVRPDFLQTLLDSDSHWMNRPIIPNQLQGGKSLFE